MSLVMTGKMCIFDKTKRDYDENHEEIPNYSPCILISKIRKEKGFSLVHTFFVERYFG